MAKTAKNVGPLARALGITRHAVYQWKSVPRLRAFQIESITDGELMAADVRKKGGLRKAVDYFVTKEQQSSKSSLSTTEEGAHDRQAAVCS